jgi:hypothetical protein
MVVCHATYEGDEMARDWLARGAAAGVLATAAMDAAMIAASRLAPERFDAPSVGLDIIGRGAAGTLRGRLRHTDITREPPLRGEIAVGLAVHYLTGITLSAGCLLALDRAGVEHRVAAATAYGTLTSLLPFLLMHPSFGFGLFARRVPDRAQVVNLMLLGHTVFGLAIGASDAVLDRRRTAEH